MFKLNLFGVVRIQVKLPFKIFEFCFSFRKVTAAKNPKIHCMKSDSVVEYQIDLFTLTSSLFSFTQDGTDVSQKRLRIRTNKATATPTARVTLIRIQEWNILVVPKVKLNVITPRTIAWPCSGSCPHSGTYEKKQSIVANWTKNSRKVPSIPKKVRIWNHMFSSRFRY